MVGKSDNKNKRREVDDRVGESIEASRRRRKESFERSRMREAVLLRNIEKFSRGIQEQFKEAECELQERPEESRGNLETTTTNNTRGVDAQIINANEKHRNFTVRMRELFNGITEQLAGLKKSIRGAAGEVKKVYLFKKYKNKIVPKRKAPTIKP